MSSPAIWRSAPSGCSKSPEPSPPTRSCWCSTSRRPVCRRQEKIQLAELLKSLRDTENLTILLVEHDMEFVMGLVDRIVVMDFGQKLCEGLPSEIRADPRVQEAYLGGVA